MSATMMMTPVKAMTQLSSAQVTPVSTPITSKSQMSTPVTAGKSSQSTKKVKPLSQQNKQVNSSPSVENCLPVFVDQEQFIVTMVSWIDPDWLKSTALLFLGFWLWQLY